MFLTDIYPATLKTRRRDPSSRRVTDIWAFKSSKSNKRYIVEIEGFENEFYGIKFYWKGVEKSPLRYSMLTNDYEPRRIIDSCINIMMQYYRRTPTLSFGFVAAPDLESDLRIMATGNQSVNRRFRLYRALMLSYFGPQTFVQIADTSSTFYLLVNRRQLDLGTITLGHIQRRINELYEGDYSL